MFLGLALRLGMLNGTGFTPSSLFTSGAQGAWYDPSDFSTLFQDAAGTTPVTAVEQPVRLMRDRSGRGNDATAPNDASRPVLRARYNLLERSEEFDNAYWTKANTTVTANAGVAPDGTTTADLFYPTTTGTDRFVWQAPGVSGISGQKYTCSVYAKASGKSFLCIGTLNGGTTAATIPFFDLSTGQVAQAGTNFDAVTIENVGSGWYRCVVTKNAVTSALQFPIFCVADASGNTTATTSGTDGILIWGAQLLTAADQTATNGAYQRIAATTDYDTSNPVWRPYLAFDGSDDGMSTASVDFTGTDKVALFAGVTKLGAETIKAIIDRQNSANPGANKGVIGLIHGVGSPIRTYDFRATTDAAISGTAQAFTESTAFNAPSTNVLTGQIDAGAPLITLRVNGSQVGSATTAQGGGNFGNFAFAIGSRTNGAGLFNGRLYSLAVLGRTATAAEISAMEPWVAGKTGVTLP